MKKLIFVLMLFALAGCVDFPAKYQPMGSEVRPARALASVEVFQTQRPTRPYRELGVITYRAGTAETFLDAVAKIKIKAAEVGADLIVIGRHGGGRGGAVPIGSVAERLARSASRPVLTVPCDLVRLDVEANAHDRH